LEKKTKGRVLYSKKCLSIPCPEFFVLYNGKDPYPDQDILRLSDLFERPEDLGLLEKAYPLLELEVKVININKGRNESIINRCKELADYSEFIATIRIFLEKFGSKEEAVREAVKYCRKHAILIEFLENHNTEIQRMILTEWNTEDAIAFAREEGLEMGLEKGQEIEKINIVRNLLAEGATPEFVQKITGLDLEVIMQLAGSR
jgi:hypothetical protein